MSEDTASRLKPAPNKLGHSPHQLKLVANGESAEADKKDKPHDEWLVMIRWPEIAFQERLPCKPFEFVRC